MLKMQKIKGEVKLNKNAAVRAAKPLCWNHQEMNRTEINEKIYKNFLFFV